MGDTANITDLTIPELRKLAATAEIDLPTSARTKAAIIDELKAGGLKGEAVHAALVDGGYLDVPADEPALPPAPPAEDSKGDSFDLDNWEPEDDLAVPTATAAAASFTEEDVPKLQLLGARVRRITKIRTHSGGAETWWCPWTDASRLTPLDAGYADRIDASGAIRVGRFAVVLPPEGITDAQLKSA